MKDKHRNIGNIYINMEETIDLQSASSIVYNKNSSDAQMEGTIWYLQP